jgi:hemoglobin-like flavoprotein
LFKGDVVMQRRLLMTTIETAVANVHRLDQILLATRDLGRRHAAMASRRGLETVAGALLGTLKQALGTEFTSAVCDAWVAYCQTLAGEMKAAPL